MSKGKYLAIDFGQRRVGLAISDYDKEIAFPRDNIAYDQMDQLIQRLADFCEKEEVSKVIIGLPISMDGTVNESFIKTQQFGEKFKKAIHPIPVEYFDERLTTKQSIQRLHQQGIKAKDQKGQRDMISAQVILESYIKAIGNRG